VSESTHSYKLDLGNRQHHHDEQSTPIKDKVRLVSNEDRHNSALSLTGSALDAVRYRDGHIQIIAAAGSGKTEVVAQRVVDLLAGGAVPESIVSFTFTERAATELKNRIDHRVAERLGTNALDRMTGLYIRTIHGFCLRLLHQHLPRYETYDVLDDNQLTALLSREAKHLGIRQLDPKNRLFASIKVFEQCRCGRERITRPWRHARPIRLGAR